MKHDVPIKPLAFSQTAHWLLIALVGMILTSTCETACLAQTAPEKASSSMPLKEHTPATRDDQPPKPDGLSAVKLIGSLALVIGLFLFAIWLFRRAAPRGAGLLPTEVFETLGRAPLAHRHQAHLLRVGNKLALISTSVAGVEPLLEITDPAEVERLTELCRESGTASASLARRKEEQDAK